MTRLPAPPRSLWSPLGEGHLSLTTWHPALPLTAPSHLLCSYFICVFLQPLSWIFISRLLSLYFSIIHPKNDLPGFFCNLLEWKEDKGSTAACMCTGCWCLPFTSFSFQRLVLITCRWHFLCDTRHWLLWQTICNFVGAFCNWKRAWRGFLTEMRMQLLTGGGWSITAVSFKKVEEREGRTYVSGNSTGLVLILLCKANMYSSIKGHCRWSRGTRVKKTRKGPWITTVPEKICNPDDNQVKQTTVSH